MQRGGSTHLIPQHHALAAQGQNWDSMQCLPMAGSARHESPFRQHFQQLMQHDAHALSLDALHQSSSLIACWWIALDTFLRSFDCDHAQPLCCNQLLLHLLAKCYTFFNNFLC